MIKKYLKKIWCWVTGGHAYSHVNLHSCYDHERKVYKFRNRCVKCGKVDKWEMPEDQIVPYLVRNVWEVDEDG